MPKYKAIFTCQDEPIIFKGDYGMALHCNFSHVLRGYHIMLYKGRSGRTGRREDSTVKQLGRQRNQFTVKVFAAPSSHTVLQGPLSYCSHRKQTDLQGKSVHAQASSRSCSLVLIIYFVSGNYGATTHMILSIGIR